MATVLLQDANFLLLDEPTNHIDIQGKEQLEQQILESSATVLITSHDRRFVDNIADRYLLIRDGQLAEIHDPADFYRLAPVTATDASQPVASDATATPATEEDLLNRIVELETLLAADLARKPKFQKPALQAAWREEIELLSKQL